MFTRVLIANRGEIACRIARTAKRLGMYVIGVYSEADVHALHRRLCDKSHLIGPPPATESYLAGERIIAVAERTGAQCVHPGYGFLAENPEFAEACVDAGLSFIGPSPQAIRTMGYKDQAKAIAENCGVPIVPGYHGERQDGKFLKEKAYQIGYPVMIKPLAGGGGKGMRRVDKHADFDAALKSAIREAHSAFGDGRVLLEKYLPSPRHIEFQVFGDRHGNLVHLFERDCSLQRRHQKVMEEAPALAMNAELRAAMGQAAIKIAAAVGYVGAGTVEFILEASRPSHPDAFWFLEMNTRLQVEHPVTEAITGLDLVAWQFRIAAGEELPLRQSAISCSGHAIEARLYAEDPERGFLPSTGALIALKFPVDQQGVRVDSGIAQGGEVTPYYDPMIAKLIAHAPTRGEAISRLAAALEQTLVAGPQTNLAFLNKLLRQPQFGAGLFDTHFIDQQTAALAAGPQAVDRQAVARGAAEIVARQQSRITERQRRLSEETNSPWDVSDAFQFAGSRRLASPVLVNGQELVAEVSYGKAGYSVTVDGEPAAAEAIIIAADNTIYVLRGGRQTVVQPKDFAALDVDQLEASGLLTAPMHGKVLAILVSAGAIVSRGQRLAVIEAMKMEHALNAPIDGRVSEILVGPGVQVSEGSRLMVITPEG